MYTLFVFVLFLWLFFGTFLSSFNHQKITTKHNWNDIAMPNKFKLKLRKKARRFQKMKICVDEKLLCVRFTLKLIVAVCAAPMFDVLM